MRFRLAFVCSLASLTLFVACSSSSDGGSTGSTSTSSGGTAGVGQAGSAQAGSAQAGSAQAGSAQAGSAQAGSAQAGSAQAGSAQAGSAQAGSAQGGSAQAGSAQAGGGQAGSSQAGSGGSSAACCANVKCGGANPICVEGSCFDLKPGQCFSSSDCGGKACVGVTVCPCKNQCFAPTMPGKCEGSTDWASCGVPGDCTVAGTGCCSPCGQAKLKDVEGVNRTKLSEHFAAVCTSDPVCPTCPSAPNPDLMGACALGQGKCVAIEVSNSGFSVCKADSDCSLRANTCCSCGEIAASSLVAVAKGQTNSYMNELGCGLVDCAPCAEPPKPPPGYGAQCDGTGHCKVVVP